jgi:UTP:GlnB (protein PII) uridylyltransferase
MAKGGLRDLQTLYWIGKYVHRAETAAELVEVGLFTESGISQLPPGRRAFCWRCGATCTTTDRPRRRSADL